LGGSTGVSSSLEELEVVFEAVGGEGGSSRDTLGDALTLLVVPFVTSTETS
jgi:hypothetical protein